MRPLIRTTDNRVAMAGAVVAGVAVLLLGSGTIRSSGELSALRERDSVEAKLTEIASAIELEIGQLDSAVRTASAGAESGHDAAQALRSVADRVWWRDGEDIGYSSSQRFSIQPADLRVALAGAEDGLIGPVTSTQGIDTILLSVAVAPDSFAGVAIGLEELWKSAGLVRLMQTGMAVRIADGDNGQPVYWTTPAELDHPVSVPIRAGSRTWMLESTPTGGWSGTDASINAAAIIAVLALAYAIGFWRLAVRPAELRAELAESSLRLTAKDGEISRLLRRQAELQSHLHESLTLDLNTGLPNRSSFTERVQETLGRRRLEPSGVVVVAAIQFSRLEGLSQSIGMGVAQQVVSQAADRLGAVVDDGQTLGRIGDNELGVCITHESVPDIPALAERYLAALDSQFSVGRRVFSLTAVIGFALSHDGHSHGPDLIGQASLAGTTAMEDGNRYSTFRPETRDERISVLRLEADLQVALDKAQLRLYFQPIVSVDDNRIAGVEALLRWRHPTASWIGPERFLPLAESMGLMPRISRWVIHQSVAYARQWMKLCEDPLYITINLTPRDLNPETCEYLYSLLDQFHVPENRIRIEITETAVVRDFRVAGRLLNELNERGIRVLLDDFGTGYSSLSYLRELPFYAVKIDKSFVQKMSTDARDFGLVKSIVGLVHYLEMECVAEGIETEEQLDLVSMMNCRYGQGYLFSRPLPPTEIEALLADRDRGSCRGTVS